jgi:restriction system protein
MSNEILEVTNTSLEEWIELIRHPPKKKIFVRNMFPSDQHRNEWLRTSHLRDNDEVSLLLRHFLVSNGSNHLDHFYAEHLLSKIHEGISDYKLSEHDRRLILFYKSKGKYPVWEGLGWIIDLLPQRPRQALNVLDAFFDAYWHSLTDNYLMGLFDAQSIIRSRYIENPKTKDQAERTLQSLNWREIEWLCGLLYENMGFDVNVTPRGNDDGVDIVAKKNKIGEKNLIVVQSKKWELTNPVGKKDIRELLGTIDLHRATNGVLVTTGRFESGAIEMAERDARIELLDRQRLLQLLNEHCGQDWFTRIDKMITNIKQESLKTSPL